MAVAACEPLAVPVQVSVAVRVAERELDAVAAAVFVRVTKGDADPVGDTVLVLVPRDEADSEGDPVGLRDSLMLREPLPLLVPLREGRAETVPVPEPVLLRETDTEGLTDLDRSVLRVGAPDCVVDPV